MAKHQGTSAELADEPTLLAVVEAICPGSYLGGNYPRIWIQRGRAAIEALDVARIGSTQVQAQTIPPVESPNSTTAADPGLRAAAEWLVHVVGYPFNLQFTPAAPEALWQAVVDVVHEDKDGSLHGNDLTRDEVADWLIDP